MSTTNLRRYMTAEASLVLQDLGAPRSKHTLRKDHLRQPGESGPKFVRDDRGTSWYWHRDLETWAAEQRAKLSEHNAPPAPFFDSKTAVKIRREKPNPLKAVAGANSDSSKETQQSSQISQLPRSSGVRSLRPGSSEAQK